MRISASWARSDRASSASQPDMWRTEHAAMPYEASCVAEFQGEGAEEEGAGGPEGDDAEALPRGERQGVDPGCGLGIQAGGQRADLVQVPCDRRVGDDGR